MRIVVVVFIILELAFSVKLEHRKQQHYYYYYHNYYYVAPKEKENEKTMNERATYLTRSISLARSSNLIG